ncbi:LOB domain-containing protein 20-like [Abrus precatorius]|uniref:LOB domain-containing protein 20-like n=1 Tax=Abrus precatorius TaxID=3816 RepID=A0A8B8L4B2_ABRPR|nr:LOB domain-containing protein 20-like [Abrus precatorius]
MAEAQVGGNGSSGVARRKALRRAMGAPPSQPPCGACKFLRRKCHGACTFAPYFSSDQGPARFAAVHKVFGASNVAKLLLHIPMERRREAVATITYEAQARLADPVYGCVSTVLALQQQVASLQGELAMVQNQLINAKLAYASALQNMQQQQQHYQPYMNVPVQPSFSNNSSASTNPMNINYFNPGFNHAMEAAPSSHSFEPLQMSPLSHDEEGDEEESRIPFNRGIVLNRH